MCPPCPRTCVHHVSGPYKKRQSNQSAFAPSYGLRCAQVPSLRFRSVGTPRRAIHGPSRLSRHPCRSTHSTEPALGLPGGLEDQKQCPPRRPTGRPVMETACVRVQDLFCLCLCCSHGIQTTTPPKSSKPQTPAKKPATERPHPQ